MARNDVHELQPCTDRDGLSRRMSVLASKKGVNTVLQSRLRAVFETLDAAQRHRIVGTDIYRLWSSFSRATQDRMWRVISEQVDADYPRIKAKADEVLKGAGRTTAGSRRVQIPAYQLRTNIHGQPGGYMLEREPGDLAAGILYEAGGNIYALGQGIGRKDSKGQRSVAFVRERFPNLTPRRILEMGCSAGGQTLDYCLAFPDAEIHAIDLSPGMINYASARTALMGGRAIFDQQDAGHTDFPDAYFDLIVSHNLFHEVEAEHMKAIARETRRLLRPGGAFIHQDVPIQTDHLEPFTQFISTWQRDFNNEPFWVDFAEADLLRIFEEAGFDPETVREEYLSALDGPISWYVVSGRK